jgi:hypothetical protein
MAKSPWRCSSTRTVTALTFCSAAIRAIGHCASIASIKRRRRVGKHANLSEPHSSRRVSSTKSSTDATERAVGIPRRSKLDRRWPWPGTPPLVQARRAGGIDPDSPIRGSHGPRSDPQLSRNRGARITLDTGGATALAFDGVHLWAGGWSSTTNISPSR